MLSPRVLGGSRLIAALHEAGIVRDKDNVTRVVIEASVTDIARIFRSITTASIYVDRIGDDRLIDVVRKVSVEVTKGDE